MTVLVLDGDVIEACRLSVGGGERLASDLELLILWQQGRCEYCGRPMMDGNTAATEDHIEPRWAGGRNSLANKCAACVTCNQAKGAMPAEVFRAALRSGGPAAVRKLRRASEAQAALAAMSRAPSSRSAKRHAVSTYWPCGGDGSIATLADVWPKAGEP